MKTTLLVLISFVLATAARADITITQKVESEGAPAGAPTMNLTMKFKGDKVRMDVGDKGSTIMDIKTGSMQTLMHEQKVVMAIPGDMLKKMQEQAAQSASEQKVEPPKPTGKKETINGFACEEYEATVNGTKVQVWVTRDLPAAEKMMAELNKLSQQSPMASIMKDQAVPGFPMKSIVEMPGGGKTTVSVVAVSENPLPDSEFAVPAGYKEMQMPAMPGGQ